MGKVFALLLTPDSHRRRRLYIDYYMFYFCFFFFFTPHRYQYPNIRHRWCSVKISNSWKRLRGDDSPRPRRWYVRVYMRYIIIYPPSGIRDAPSLRYSRNNAWTSPRTGNGKGEKKKKNITPTCTPTFPRALGTGIISIWPAPTSSKRR